MAEVIAGCNEIPKVISLRWANRCGCGTELPVGTKASWDKPNRTMRCVPCHDKQYCSAITPAVSDGKHARPEAPVPEAPAVAVCEVTSGPMVVVREPHPAERTIAPESAPPTALTAVPQTPVLRAVGVRWKPVTCGCGTELTVGAKASYEVPAKTMRCLPCGERRAFQLATDTAGPIEHTILERIDTGKPGGSITAEYERRAQKRETAVRTKHPWIGGLILALSDEPQSQRAFAKGAAGERKVAASLQSIEGILLLHNRKLSISRRDGDIDHLAITGVGVFVIDAKNYAGSNISLKSTGGLLSPLREQLLVNGREQRALLTGIAKQLEAVATAMASWEGAVLGRVPIQGVLAFVGGNFLRSSGFRIDGVLCTGPKGMREALAESGSRLPDAAQDSLHRHLARMLPAA